MINDTDTMCLPCLLRNTIYHHLIMFRFDQKKGNIRGTLQEKKEHCSNGAALRRNIRRCATQFRNWYQGM